MIRPRERTSLFFPTNRSSRSGYNISYELQGYGQSDEKLGGPPEVVYVYRHVNDEAKMEYREMLRSEVRKRVGNVPVARLIEPTIL